MTLTGPNEQMPGFETILNRAHEIRFRPIETADTVYQMYTREQVVSGEAATLEQWLREMVKLEKTKPSLWSRLKRVFGS